MERAGQVKPNSHCYSTAAPFVVPHKLHLFCIYFLCSISVYHWYWQATRWCVNCGSVCECVNGLGLWSDKACCVVCASRARNHQRGLLNFQLPTYEEIQFAILHKYTYSYASLHVTVAHTTLAHDARMLTKEIVHDACWTDS